MALLLPILLVGAVSVVHAQKVQWELSIQDPGASIPSEGWFDGNGITWDGQDQIFVTGKRMSGRGAGIAAVSTDGSELWSHVITDVDSVINPGIGDPKNIYVTPIFPYYDSVSNNVVFFGHQFVTISSDYGPLYIVRFTQDGRPIDTVAGTRDRVLSSSLTVRWVHLRDGSWAKTSDFPFSFHESAYSIYFGLYTPGLRVDEDSGTYYRYWYPGDQWTEPQYHLPRDIVETRNGDLAIWGVGGTVNQLGRKIYRPFFFRMTADGDSLTATNPITLYDGTGVSQRFSETADGGFVGTYVSVADSTEGGVPTRYDAVVIRLDSVGNRIWEHPVGGKDRGYLLYDAEELPDGGIIAAGMTYYFDPENPGSNLPNSTQNFLIRLSASGEVEWEYEWGEEGIDDAVRDFLVLPDGDVVVVGLRWKELYVARVGTGISSVKEEERVEELDLSMWSRK